MRRGRVSAQEAPLCLPTFPHLGTRGVWGLLRNARNEARPGTAISGAPPRLQTPRSPSSVQSSPASPLPWEGLGHRTVLPPSLNTHSQPSPETTSPEPLLLGPRNTNAGPQGPAQAPPLRCTYQWWNGGQTLSPALDLLWLVGQPEKASQRW